MNVSEFKKNGWIKIENFIQPNQIITIKRKVENFLKKNYIRYDSRHINFVSNNKIFTHK